MQWALTNYSLPRTVKEDVLKAYQLDVKNYVKFKSTPMFQDWVETEEGQKFFQSDANKAYLMKNYLINNPDKN